MNIGGRQAKARRAGSELDGSFLHQVFWAQAEVMRFAMPPAILLTIEESEERRAWIPACQKNEVTPATRVVTS